jgi:predicted PurR-regulated permease PerM
MRRLQTLLWNSRALATTVMTIVLLLVFVVPLWLAIATIVDSSDQILSWAQAVGSMDLPPPPSWLAELPVVGPKAAHLWQDLVDTGLHELLQKAWPVLRPHPHFGRGWSDAAGRNLVLLRGGAPACDSCNG